MPEISTINDHLVGSNGRTITMLLPLVDAEPEEALRAAAWIVALADHMSPVKFADIHAALCNL